MSPEKRTKIVQVYDSNYYVASTGSRNVLLSNDFIDEIKNFRKSMKSLWAKNDHLSKHNLTLDENKL